MMEKMIAKSVRERLDTYYPGQGYILQDINRISTKPGSQVYRIRLHSVVGGGREIYAKEYPESCSQNIQEMWDMKHLHDLFLMPRMLDYVDGFTLTEGVPGGTLTGALLRGILSIDREKLIECSRKIGWAIGALQNVTTRGTKRGGDLDLYLVNEIETEDYFKRILSKDLLADLRAQAEELRGLKTRVAQCHGDPSPHNILMRDGRTYLIDYSYQDNATFLDPSLYMISLELVKNRLGGALRDIISLMEDSFREAYYQMVRESYDRPIWTTVKTLNYLHFLLMYATRHRTIKNYLVGAVDSRYLLRKVKEGLK